MPLGGGLWCDASLSLPYGRGDMVLFIIKFSFIHNQISKVFDGIMVYVFHEGFGVSYGDFKID